MFTLSVVFGSASVGFMFKTQESAESAAASLLEIATGDGFKMGIPPGSRISIKDDFGQHGIFNASSIHGVIIEDLEQTQLARAEQMVHQARCQNKAAKLAQESG